MLTTGQWRTLGHPALNILYIRVFNDSLCRMGTQNIHSILHFYQDRGSKNLAMHLSLLLLFLLLLLLTLNAGQSWQKRKIYFSWGTLYV